MNFNTSNVTIQQVIPPLTRPTIPNFNTSNVTIQQITSAPLAIYKGDFNTSNVTIQRRLFDNDGYHPNRFQYI